MRYPAPHKEATRQLIVERAASLFQRKGAGASIPALMKAVQLTHGGFYRHFVSKDHLFDEALQWRARDVARRLGGFGRRQAALTAIIDAYLGEAHCDDLAQGCPLAALGPDISRLRSRRRDAGSRAMAAYCKSLAPYVPGATTSQRAERAAVILSSMAGSLMLARTMTDKRARRRFLRAARAYHAFAAMA